MMQPSVGKQVLIIEDEPVFRSLMDSWFSSLGAITAIAGDGPGALDLLGYFEPDLMIYDPTMPRMNGLKPVEYLRNRDDQTPILVILATENTFDIAEVLRLGADDVLLKLVKDLNRLWEAVFACLYPNVFSSHVGKEERLFRDWDAMADNPAAATKLLKKLQLPVSQVISYCCVNYRQLVIADQPGLVSNITPLSDHDLVFYCLGAAWTGGNGVLTVLLLRALSNDLLQEQLTQQNQRLPKLGILLKQVNHLLR